MNTITIELCAEDRARLDAIIDRLSGAMDCQTCAQTFTDAVRGLRGSVKPTGQAVCTATEPDAPQAATEPKTEAKTGAGPEVTIDQIRKKVVQLTSAADPETKNRVRSIIQAYARKVSDLPADKLGDVWGQLTLLEQEA